MPTLHIVNKSAFARDALSACLARAAEGDCLLLIEDGVGSVRHPTLRAAAARLQVFVLREDAAARGIADASIPPEVTLTDYPGFVALAARCHPIIGWS